MDGMKRNDGKRNEGYNIMAIVSFDYIADYSEIVNYCANITVGK